MSRPDVSQRDLEGWLDTAYVANLRAHHDTLAERTRATASGSSTGGWRAAVLIVAVAITVLACAGLRVASSFHGVNTTAVLSIPCKG